MTSTMLLVLAFVVVNGEYSNNVEIPEDSSSAYNISKMPELDYYDDYKDLKANEKVAVIYPIITQSAYDWNGFHDYYAGYCDSCLEAKMHDSYEKTFSASGNGFRILEFLGYQVIDDIDIDKNPAILDNYDKIILLHNEYVTKKEFDAIVNHPKVVYLYPNSLSSQVLIDYSKNTITLLRGPGYPDTNIKNGFDWEYDNTQYFNDWNCDNWKFYTINNGYMLNCYPETFLPNYGYELLKTLKNL